MKTIRLLLLAVTLATVPSALFAERIHLSCNGNSRLYTANSDWDVTIDTVSRTAEIHGETWKVHHLDDEKIVFDRSEVPKNTLQE